MYDDRVFEDDEEFERTVQVKESSDDQAILRIVDETGDWEKDFPGLQRVAVDVLLSPKKAIMLGKALQDLGNAILEN